MTARVLKAPEVVVSETPPVPPESVRAAIEEAFRQGRDVGRAEGSRALDAALATLNETLVTTTAELAARASEGVLLDAALVVDLAADLCSWYLGTTAAGDADLFRAALQGPLTAMADEANLVLELHPDVIDVLGDESRLGAVTVRADPSLAPADFRLTGDATTIEHRWEHAIAELRDELVRAIDMERNDLH